MGMQEEQEEAILPTLESDDGKDAHSFEYSRVDTESIIVGALLTPPLICIFHYLGDCPFFLGLGCPT